jgi:hypothetical protein
VVPDVEDLAIRLNTDEAPGSVGGRCFTPQPSRGQNHRTVVSYRHHLTHTAISEVPETMVGWTPSAERREEGGMHIISWNPAGRQRRIPQQVEMLASCGPDLVAL